MEKKNLVPNSAHTRPGQENSEKNSKQFKKIKIPLPGIIFRHNGDEIGREIGEKILVPYTVHTRPGKEKYENNSKKVQKIKKPISGIIFSQNEMK